MKYLQIVTSVIIFCTSISTLDAYTKVIGHRGASSVAPENTLASFQQAADFHADYFELDVYLSKDDSLVVIHDKSVNRTTNGSGFVTLMTFEQLRELDAGSWFDPQFAGEKIPTLKEALLLGRENNTKVCIEIKGSKTGIVEKIVDLVEKLDMQKKVIIFGFSYAQVSLARQLDPTIPALYLVDNISQQNIDKAAEIGAQAVGAGDEVDLQTLNYAHAKNIEIWRWTINGAAKMSDLLALGIDGIITNYPQLLRGIMEDVTPPSDVTLAEAVVSGTTIALNWQAAVDPESEIAGYQIYRDTTANAATLYRSLANVTAFTDETFQEEVQFFYRIKAVNFAGMSSANFSNEIAARTESDVLPPEIVSVLTEGQKTTLFVEFNERVNRAMAADVANYEIDNGIIINAAKVSLDDKTVILSVSELSPAIEYNLTIKKIEDQAAVANAASNLTAAFQYVENPSGLIAFWPMDEGEGETIQDVSGNDNRGIFKNGVAWGDGKTANGLHFDGTDDFVQLQASESLDINNNAVTLTAWVKLEILPGDLPGAFGPIYDSESDCYVLYEDRGNKELRFKVSTTSGAERPGIKEQELTLNEWLYIVGVYDGERAMIYLNGVLMDEHTGLSGNVKSGQIAKLGESMNSFFRGSIDNIQVYNRALSENEINVLYAGAGSSTGVEKHRDNVVADFSLQQNYPNPFNPTTTILYRVPSSSAVELVIYNVLGHKVRTLVSEEQSSGSHEAVWDGRDDRGRQTASGLYFYQLKAGNSIQRQRMILAR